MHEERKDHNGTRRIFISRVQEKSRKPDNISNAQGPPRSGLTREMGNEDEPPRRSTLPYRSDACEHDLRGRVGAISMLPR